MIEVTKCYEVEAIHCVPAGPPGCTEEHKHVWLVEVCVRGGLNRYGEVVHEEDLDTLFHGTISKRIENKPNLNEWIARSTVEHIALEFFRIMDSVLKRNGASCSLRSVTVWDSNEKNAKVSDVNL